jgi:5-methylcytosine-specific restriction endonuclease McrA
MTSQLRPSGSTTAWRRTRARILHRDHYRCQYPVDGGICGARATVAGHIIARSQWPPGQPGVDADTNLRAECKRHSDKGGAELTNGKPAIDIPAYRTPLWEG